MRFTEGSGLVVYDDLSYAMYASTCERCRRIYFKIQGKNYSWVDGCDCATYVRTYILVK